MENIIKIKNINKADWLFIHILLESLKGRIALKFIGTYI